MIVERFIVVGIKHNRKMITDVVNASNANNYSSGNGIDLNITLNFIDDTVSPIITDHKKFDYKDDAIRHISVIKAQNYLTNDMAMSIHNVASWTIYSVYDEVYDAQQVRKYKIIKLQNRSNRSIR
jgi:hypothetical protein